jgi:hypothetical protein
LASQSRIPAAIQILLEALNQQPSRLLHQRTHGAPY